MNNDLISREAAKQAMRDAYFQNYGYAIMALNYVPAVDAAPKWISVQDRLPEDAGGAVDAVLVTDGFLIHMAYFNHGTWYFCESGEMKEEMFYNVTHWMPLPEPPKMDTGN